MLYSKIYFSHLIAILEKSLRDKNKIDPFTGKICNIKSIGDYPYIKGYIISHKI